MFKLKDLQGAEMFESLEFKYKQDVKKHLFDFHSQDLNLTGNETLEQLCDIGCWELIEI